MGGNFVEKKSSTKKIEKMVEKMLIHNFFSHKGKRKNPDQTSLVRMSSFPLMREKIVNQHFFDHFFSIFLVEDFFFDKISPHPKLSQDSKKRT
jgi:hypothetical protein